MGFPAKNDHLGVFWGYHHLRKHPNGLHFQKKTRLLHVLQQKRWNTSRLRVYQGSCGDCGQPPFSASWRGHRQAMAGWTQVVAIGSHETATLFFVAGRSHDIISINISYHHNYVFLFVAKSSYFFLPPLELVFNSSKCPTWPSVLLDFVSF